MAILFLGVVEKTQLNFLETQYWCLESAAEKQQMWFFKLALQQNHFQLLISTKKENALFTPPKISCLAQIKYGISWNKMHLQEIVQMLMFPDLEHSAVDVKHWELLNEHKWDRRG